MMAPNELYDRSWTPIEPADDGSPARGILIGLVLSTVAFWLPLGIMIRWLVDH